MCSLIYPTLKCASYALENWLGVKSAIAKMDDLLEKAALNRITTKDQGGNKKTSEVIRYILDNWK